MFSSVLARQPSLACQVPSSALCAPQRCSRALILSRSQKGFADTKGDSRKKDDSPDAPSTSGSSASGNGMDGAIDALEARIRSRRARKVDAQALVQVQSAVVDEVTGKTPARAESQAETQYVTFLFVLFVAVIMEGLLIAASGFLPEDWDAFVTDSLYPNYSWTVLLFLGASSAYGLYKTGKLPGMTQQP